MTNHHKETGFSSLLADVCKRPDDLAGWDELEAQAASEQTPEPVAEAYAEVLSRDIPLALGKRLGDRALRFCEEWFADETPLMQSVLLRVFDRDPADEAVFDRLSMGLTAVGSWERLLEIYKKAIDATDSSERRIQLLDDAVRVAKDLAQDPDQAILFMQRLLPLRPQDQSLRASLERLLERSERWPELIALWDSGTQGETAEATARIKVQIASCWFARMKNARAALTVLSNVLEENPEHAEALALSERLLTSDDAATGTRREVLELLRATYVRSGRPLDVARVVRASLSFAQGQEREDLHREAATLWLSEQVGAEALTDLGELFVLRPDDDALANEIEGVVEKLGAQAQWVAFLERAGDEARTSRRAGELRLRAATFAHHPVGDIEKALELCERVFLDDSEPGLSLDAGRALDALLEAKNKHAARLPVLERLAALEMDAERRREVLGALARLSHAQGDHARAVATWTKRLAEHAQDSEALDGLVELYEGEKDYRALVDVLRRRVTLKEGVQAGRDLARIAEVHAEALDEIESALVAWNEVHAVAPKLIGKLGVGELIARAATREGTRTGRVLCALGDAYRSLLGETERACFYYSRALASDATLEEAQKGLVALLEHDAVRAQAADALAGAYATTEQASALLALLPHRMFGAATSGERARLLRQAALLAERGGDAARAFEHLCAALVEDPESNQCDADLRRLGQELSGWESLANAALAAAEKLEGSHPRLAQLRALEAELAEGPLGDNRRALLAYVAALRAAPSDATLIRQVVRVSAASGEFKPAVDVILAQAQRADQSPDELLTLLEAQVATEDAYRSLAQVATEVIDGARLNPPVKRELAMRFAAWHEKHCQDLSSAQALLQKAHLLGAPHAETLRRLIALQRHEPGEALFGSLMALSELSQDEFAPLSEAHELARDVLRDVELERRVLGLMFRRAAAALLQGRRQLDGQAMDVLAHGAALRLAELFGEQQDSKSQVLILREASQLPLDATFARDLAERAATVAAQLGDVAGAATLYQRALEHAPDSPELLASLADAYRQLGRLEELLVLRRRELSLTTSVERRLELRLDIARVMAEIEARGGRFGALRENLRDAPGHEASLLALEAALRERGALLEVHDLFASQAAQLEGLGDTARAAQLWSNAACLSEHELKAQEKALFAFQRVCDLAPTDDALEALARIRLARNEHGHAVPWLEKRLERMRGEERVSGFLRLARAYESAESTSSAIECLVRGVQEAPDVPEFRDMLSKLYRKTGRVSELAPMLADHALRATDKNQILASAREAAELFCGPCGQPERAVDVLSRAIEMDPEDRALKCLYADALVAAGRIGDAQAVLDGMIVAFGRRRSVERAEVHMRLSRVAQAAGNIEEALSQLDTASSMDRTHTGILRALGELSHRAGQLDRAERAYRALLMVVKKPQPNVPQDVGVAEVLYLLHRVASEQDQAEKATELLEGAVAAAVQSEDETARLKRVLTDAGDAVLLLRVLEQRLTQVGDSLAEAAARSDLADAFELHPERKHEALDERLRALSCAPEQEALHRKALSLAEAHGEARKYAEAVRSLYERARRKEDMVLASELALRAASVYEHALGDLNAAEAQYRGVREDAPGYVEAQFSLARVAGKLGHAEEERNVLARIVELPDDPAYAAGKTGARYRVAELLLESAATRDAGYEALVALVKQVPDHARLGAILQAACARDPHDVRGLELLEQNARQSQDPGLLLDFLERHAKGQEPSLALIREGAELAVRMQENARAEALLRKAIRIAEQGEGLADALWAPVALGRLRNQMSDVSGALDWLERAMHASDSFESFELGLEAAALAEGRGKDPGRSIRIYEALRERDPTERRVWSALLALYKKTRNLDAALTVVQATLDALIDPAERNALRVETAKMLLESQREDDGKNLLKDVLGEDPDHEEASMLLADLYERTGENEAMAELLGRKLESARERRSPSLVPIALRMGNLLEGTRPDQAVEIYREGLAILPESYDLMRATLSMLDPERDAAERASLLERYLAGDGRTDEHALLAAIWLLEYQTQTGDEAAFERALAIAYHVSPGHDEIRTRLEQWYRQRGDHENLAQMLEQEAARSEDSARSLELLMEVADIRLTHLSQPSEASATLRRARVYAPNDLNLLKRAVIASAAAGELGAALAEIDQALAESSRKKRERVELLLLRAELAGGAGMFDEAVDALDGAHKYAGAAVLPQLMAGVEQARLGAQNGGNVERERELTLRMVNLQGESGALAEASELLNAWVLRAPRDVEALRILIQLLVSAERWAEVISVAESLVREDQPEILGAVGERLVLAARSLGRLELAQKGLEQALERAGDQVRVVELLSELYEELSEKQALAELMLRYLSPNDPADKRFEQLRRVGQLLLDAGDSERALWALTQAWELRPDDAATVLFIADAQIAARRFQEAQDLLEKAMNACKQRRSPELAQLRYRMARLSSAAGDSQARLEWLNSALDADMNNGDVASELAVVAQNMGDLDTALKALRAITMLKTDAPMTRAEAFYRQAVIVAQKGEPRRAVLWAKKAKAENANFPGVDALLAELGEAS